MRDLFLSELLQVAQNLGVFKTKTSEDGNVIDQGFKDKNVPAFESYIPILADLGLSGAKVSLGRFIALLKKDVCTWGTLLSAQKSWSAD